MAAAAANGVLAGKRRRTENLNCTIVQLKVVHSTITVRADLKDRLSILKGERSWDEFLAEVAADYPAEEAIKELERRLADLRSGRVKGVPRSSVKRKHVPRRK